MQPLSSARVTVRLVLNQECQIGAVVRTMHFKSASASVVAFRQLMGNTPVCLTGFRRVKSSVPLNNPPRHLLRHHQRWAIRVTTGNEWHRTGIHNA
jgi:hypothetical protein